MQQYEVKGLHPSQPECGQALLPSSGPADGLPEVGGFGSSLASLGPGLRKSSQLGLPEQEELWAMGWAGGQG
jgi:hypothetical protein